MEFISADGDGKQGFIHVATAIRCEKAWRVEGETLILCCCIISHSHDDNSKGRERGKKTLWIICNSIIIKGSSLLEKGGNNNGKSSHFNSHGDIFVSSLIWSCYMWRLQPHQTRRNHNKWDFSFTRSIASPFMLHITTMRLTAKKNRRETTLTEAFFIANKNKSCHHKTTSKLTT